MTRAAPPPRGRPRPEAGSACVVPQLLIDEPTGGPTKNLMCLIGFAPGADDRSRNKASRNRWWQRYHSRSGPGRRRTDSPSS